MKKSIIYVMIALLALSTVAAQPTITGEELEATLLQYEPVPAHPGDLLEVWVKLENKGSDLAKNVRLEMEDNYPFKLESERRLHNIGTLPGENAYVAKFRMRVDQDAPTGTSNIKVRFAKGDEGRWREAFLSVDIDSRITALEIESVKLEPKSLVPGAEGQLKIKIRNTANTQIRDVTTKLDLDDSEAPIVPVQSSTELRIDSLAPDETKEFVFNIMAELDASSNAYKLPVDISFKDDKGSEISYDTFVGVVIKSPPELIVTVDSSNVYSNDRNGKVTLKFVNKGLDEIKFLTMELSDSDDYKLLDPTRNFYVGNIDSDDYEIQELNIEALDGDKVDMPMTIQYRDAANNLHETQETITLDLVKKETVTQEESNSTTWIIGLILVAAIGLYFWRRKKKKRG